MTDFTHHTPRLLSDADAAADLAGVARPSEGLRLLYDYGQAITASGDSEEIYMHYAAAREYIKAIEAERDELASRVKELEAEVLDQCRLNGMGAERESALMGRVREMEGALKECAAVCAGETMSKQGLINALEKARAALNASKEQT